MASIYFGLTRLRLEKCLDVGLCPAKNQRMNIGGAFVGIDDL